jgi:hypothetical protein
LVAEKLYIRKEEKNENLINPEKENERENLRSFLDELLNVVFSETAMPGVVDLADERDRFGLAHGHHSDLVGRAPGQLGGSLDSLQDGPEGSRCDAVYGGCRGGHVRATLLHHHVLLAFFLVQIVRRDQAEGCETLRFEFL